MALIGLPELVLIVCAFVPIIAGGYWILKILRREANKEKRG